MLKNLSSLIVLFVTSNAFAIWNGVPVTPRTELQKHVVALTQNGQIFCTGTLIRPDVVVTAAHCVYGEQATSFRIYFGNFERELAPFVGVGNLPVPSRNSPFRTVVDALVHPRYNPARQRVGVGSGDVALLKLGAAAPAPFVPVKVTATDHILFLRGILNVLGYGRSYESDNSAAFSELKISRENVRTAIFEPSMFTYTAKESGVCPGDSGGPLFHRYHDDAGNVVTELVGITSFIRPTFSFIPANVLPKCGEEATNYFVNINKYAAWIQQNLR